MKKIAISNLCVTIEDKEILKNLNLTIEAGDVIAIIGPNGHGKSTLLKAIMGHYATKVTKGDIKVDGKSILKLPTNKRANLGIYLAHQNPLEINGVVTIDFLKTAVNANREKPIKLFEFYKTVNENSAQLNMSQDLLQRYLNEGFSGGEKKKNEILQMNLTNPDFILLDEIDSGLDVDALKTIVKQLKVQVAAKKAIVYVSHNNKLFNEVIPNKVVIIINGTIVKTGDISLARKIDKEGYHFLEKELNIKIHDVKPQMFDDIDSFGAIYHDK